MSSTLKAQVFSGLKWSILAKGLTQLFSWISTFLVIRWLTPEDYGVMAISMVFFTLISYFTTNGLTSVIIKEEKQNPLLESQMFTFSLFLNIALSATLIVLSYPLSNYYNSPDLVDVMLLMAIINPVTSFSVVPVARLQKNMQFKEKSIVESAAALISVIIAFSMAYAGYGYWALVYSTAGMLVSRTIIFRFYTQNWPKPTFDTTGIKPALAFAWKMQVGTLIWFIYNKVDTVILGRLLGMEKLGVYNVAGDIASIPLSKGSAILNDVGFSAFSKVQNDLNLAKHYASRSIFLLGLVMFPIFYGISAVSHPMVSSLLGEKWIDAAPVISILCLVFPFRMFSSVLSNFSNAMGDASFNLQNVVMVCAMLIVSIATGAQYGLIGAAWGWVIGYTLAFIVMMLRFVKRYKFTTKQIVPYALTWLVSSFMLITVFATEKSIDGVNSWLELLMLTMLGAAIFTPIAYFKYKKDIASIFRR